MSHQNPVSVVLLVVAGVVVIALSLLLGRSVRAQAEGTPELNRGEVNALITQAQAALDADLENSAKRVTLANLHYQAGHFETASALVEPVFASSLEALNLMVNLEYLFGHYDRAEAIVRGALADNPTNVEAQILGHLLLGKIAYHTNRFAEVQETVDLIKQIRTQGGQLDLPGVEELLTWVASFDQPPYRPDWAGVSETALPFLATDPLPIVQVQINGTPIYVIIDTGGAAFILDKELAATLGIEPVTTMLAGYGGGLAAETGLARAESLTLGGVTLKTVPVMTLPVAEMTASGFSYPIQGILTTNVLEQFLATIDYPSGQLVLRPKTEAALTAVRQQNAGKTVTEVPFYLAELHQIMAKGMMNGTDDLTFFVDSGLAHVGAMSAPRQTLEYLGLPIPQTIFNENNRGGGGAYASGTFPLAALGLGSLRQENLLGEYGSMAPETYWEKGFIQDGLISHNFLKHYAWTIDFTNRVLLFAAPQ